MKMVVTLTRHDMERLLRRETLSIHNPSGSIEISVHPELSNDEVLEIMDQMGEMMPIDQIIGT